MKILWLCNGCVSSASMEYGIENGGISWIDSILEAITKQDTINLSVAFPITSDEKVVKKEKNKVQYYGFLKKKDNPTIYDNEIETIFESIIKEIQPDIVHIFGTEFPHTLSMVRICNKLGIGNRVIISIQGLCYYIARHYCASLPMNIVKKYTFRDWDKACVKQLNKEVQYYKCNENMRESFYMNQWALEKCERHSIFISQSYYPLKGFHHVLEAAAIIKRYYKDIKVYTTGTDVFELTKIEKVKESSYSSYIRSLICQYGLRDNVKFLGYLSEGEMCERYLKSHVFVSASSIENSSNSVAEAMLLGMPIVASAVGGVPDMLEDRKEGFLYQSDASYMLAHYVMKMFDNDEIAKEYGLAARKRALYAHDRDLNNQKLVEIYEKVVEECR